MAIIKCPECSGKVSDAASCCPHCGYPIAENLHNASDNGTSIDLQEIIPENTETEATSGIDVEPETKLYQKTWFAFVMLFVCFPVGCFLIWKYEKVNLPVRIVSSVVCGSLFLFLILMLIAQLSPCGHQWKAATCETPMTCKICGATSGKAAGHEWKSATCSAPKTCKICGKTTGTAAGHEWKAATCSAPKTCEVCGKTSGAVAGHEWEAATCFTPKTCAVCQVTEGNNLSHSFTAKVTTSEYLCAEATETSPATYYYSCSRCQTAGTETFTHGQQLRDSWGYNYYVGNEFGEESNLWFITTQKPLDGSFENAQVEGADLLAEIVYDCYSDITIFLYEFGDMTYLVKNNSSQKAYYKIAVQNEKGNTFEARGQMLPDMDRIIVIGQDYTKILDMMQTSKKLKFFIQPEDSAITEYRFEVDMNNFNEVLQEVK